MEFFNYQYVNNMLFGMAESVLQPAHLEWWAEAGKPPRMEVCRESETPLEPQEAHIEMVCVPFNELAGKRLCN